MGFRSNRRIVEPKTKPKKKKQKKRWIYRKKSDSGIEIPDSTSQSGDTLNYTEDNLEIKQEACSSRSSSNVINIRDFNFKELLDKFKRIEQGLPLSSNQSATEENNSDIYSTETKEDDLLSTDVLNTPPQDTKIEQNIEDRSNSHGYSTHNSVQELSHLYERGFLSSQLSRASPVQIQERTNSFDALLDRWKSKNN